MFVEKTNENKSLVYVFKGTIFAAYGFVKENATLISIVHTTCGFFFSYFSSEKDTGVTKIVSHMFKSPFYQNY